MMLRFFGLIMFSAALMTTDAQERFALSAPDGWGGETIKLPPGFAPNMTWTGVEHIRFAPGMMQSTSDSFFCYAFVFELNLKAELSKAAVEEEFLKYYRGLSRAVLNGKLPDSDPSSFTLELQLATGLTDKTGPSKLTEFTGTLNWIEPFATRKKQDLNVEIQAWKDDAHSYVFACISPQPKDADIWKQLHKIRDGYLQNGKQAN